MYIFLATRSDSEGDARMHAGVRVSVCGAAEQTMALFNEMRLAPCLLSKVRTCR